MAKKTRERVNLRLPPDLTAWARKWASANDTNFTDTVEKALTRFRDDEGYLVERRKGKLRAADL